MVENIELTRNFRLSEFLVSHTYPDLAAELNPDPYQINCLKLLCESILQPIRERFGPLTIESGFRSPELNLSVGGAETSDHRIGSASDITLHEGLGQVYRWIKRNHLPYRQLIWYKNKRFIHVSINTPGRTFKHEAWIT